MTMEKALKIDFPWGIPGLEEDREYTLSLLADDSPFYFLQSTSKPEVGLILISPFTVFGDYEFDLTEDITKMLEINNDKQVAVFCVVNTSRGIQSLTVNLLAPIVINTEKHVGKQVVLNEHKFSLRAPLAINKEVAGGQGNACAGA